MDGFWASISKWFNEKTSSPLYFTFVLFLIAWNWKFFQIIFLENADLFHAPRIEYIDTHLLISFSAAWLPQSAQWTNTGFVWLANGLWHIIPPALFTYVAIVYLPSIHAWAFRIYLRNHFARKAEHRDANVEYEKGETKKLTKVASEKKKQAVQKDIINRNQTDEERWQEEFLNFEKHPIYGKISQLVNIVYNKSGATRKHDISGVVHRFIDSDVLAASDTKGLITISGEGPRERVELTNKGKYFIEKYLENNPI